MKNILFSNHRHYWVATLGVVVLLFGSGLAQRRNTTVTKSAPSILATLPASDAVALVKLRRVLDEVVPKILATNPGKLAEVNSEIEKFKTRTGLDPRSFDELALGLRYSYPSEGVTRVHTVAIARGSFDPKAMVAAGRVAANGKYREEKYQGTTIYVFTLDQRMRLLGLLDVRIGELAVAPIDANTLALGEPERVRSAIDAKRNNGDVNSALTALATQDPNAILGFGGNISPALVQNIGIGNDAIAADLANVKQMYGSFGMTAKDLEVLIAARTLDAGSARSLSDTAQELKQLGSFFISRLSGTKGALAKSALANLKITTQGNELQIRTAVAQSEVAPLIGRF